MSLELKKLFDAKGLTLAVAESASGGNLSAMITETGGASSYFQGGVIVYSLIQKVALLGVDESHAKEVNCVSEQVAMEMASGVRKLFGTDVGVSITGYAQPYKEIKYPFAWIGFSIGDRCWAAKVGGTLFGSDVSEEVCRVEVQKDFAWGAVESLIEILECSK